MSLVKRWLLELEEEEEEKEFAELLLDEEIVQDFLLWEAYEDWIRNLGNNV